MRNVRDENIKIEIFLLTYKDIICHLVFVLFCVFALLDSSWIRARDIPCSKYAKHEL